MHASLAPSPSSLNSTIVRNKNRGAKLAAALAWPLVRAYFAVTSRVLPRVARRQAEHLFSAPPRYRGRRVEGVAAREERVVSGRHSLAVWSAGPREAPAVLLVHGWGGRGMQMTAFVPALLASGHRVVWFDQPAHGASGQGAASLPDFVRAIGAVASTHGPFHAAIGHSLGAAALCVALREGLPLGRVVLVSPPASITEHAHRFARMLGITPAIREAMRQRLERRFGMRFADLDSIDELARVAVPALFVHDADDVDVPIDNAHRLAARLRNSRFVTTYGLGHHRILREPSVVAIVAHFVRGDDADLPDSLPALPRPAPIY